MGTALSMRNSVPVIDDQNLFTVSRRISHHAGRSGYDELARYVGTSVEIPGWVHRIRGIGAVHRFFRRRSGMEWYDGLYTELFTSMHMRRTPFGLYHFLFPERDYRYLPALQPERKHKIIGTFHATPAEFRTVMKHTEHLESMDAAIVVARNQTSVLETILGKDKVHFIPHGVDVEYFVPPSETHKPKGLCICVGHHHRYFETLARVAAIAKKRDADVRFIVVNRVFDLYFDTKQQSKFRVLFSDAGNVELRANLTDDQLLHLYQTSDLMVLPLLDATANVAVLEALSCGLPMVVTDVGGIRDYVDPHCAVFAAPQNAENMADQILSLLQNPDQRLKLSQASRRKALTFDWTVVRDQIKALYSQVMGSK